MKLIANECLNCRRPVGFLAKGALLIPTLCPLCVFDKETMMEWGHKIAKGEKPLGPMLADLRWRLNRLDLPKTTP